MLIALSIFDIFVIALIYLEYRAIALRQLEKACRATGPRGKCQ
jgi:uncharacterized membrane protein